MFDRLFDRWRNEAKFRLRPIFVALACVLSAALALCFLFAAVFVIAVERHGAVDACLGSAALFLVVTAILAVIRAAFDARRRRRAVERAAEATPLSPLADPRTILISLQIIQAIGLKRLAPLLAVGGAAFVIALAQDPARRRASPPRPKPHGSLD